MVKRLENLNLELLNLACLFLGVLLTLAALLINNDDIKTILISIGTSIISSSIVVYLSSHYLVKESKVQEMMNTWKLHKIYSTRAEMNRSTNICLRDCNTQIDIIAFGLKGFRQTQSYLIEGKIRNGVRLRILTIEPQSQFLSQREIDEGEVQGQIRNTIIQLTAWVNNLKSLAPDPNNVELKYYDTLPLDFYFRVDNNLFLGPYMYGKSSQQTISYEFEYGGLGFQYWSTYFEDIWSNQNFAKKT